MRKGLSMAMILLLVSALLAACGSGSSDAIKIGGNLELSGGVSSYGQSIKKGAELAIEEINNAGGINGKKIDWVLQDNKSDASEASNVANRLINQDKVVAIIGAATSGNTLAQLDQANSNKVVILTPSGTNTKITVNDDGSINPFAFRTIFIDPFQGEVGAGFAYNDLGVRTAAVYIESSSDYSKGLAEAFIQTFEGLGGKIVAQEAYISGDTDFKSTLTRIKSANPEFVYIPGYYTEVGLIVKQARELGLNVPMMGGDGWESSTLVETAGADALENTFYTNSYSAEDQDPVVQNFIKSYQNKYNEVPDAFAALGYDSVKFLADALSRSGGEGGDKLRQAMEQTSGLRLVTGTLRIDEKHDPIKAAVILEFKDGVPTFRTSFAP